MWKALEDRNGRRRVPPDAAKFLTAKHAKRNRKGAKVFFAAFAVFLCVLCGEAFAYCKLSCVSFTAQRVFAQLPTLTTPWVLKYTLDACPDVLVLSTIIPLTPPG